MDEEEIIAWLQVIFLFVVNISTVSCLFAHLFFSIQIQGIPCKVFVSTTMMTLTYWKYWIFINITSNASNIVSTDNTKRSQARASKISTKIDTEVRQIRTNGTHIDYKPYHHNSRQCYRLFVITGGKIYPFFANAKERKSNARYQQIHWIFDLQWFQFAQVIYWLYEGYSISKVDISISICRIDCFVCGRECLCVGCRFEFRVYTGCVSLAFCRSGCEQMIAKRKKKKTHKLKVHTKIKYERI